MMGLVLPAGLTLNRPDRWCHPGSCRLVRQGRVKVHATGRACDLIRACATKPHHWCVRPPGRCVPSCPVLERKGHPRMSKPTRIVIGGVDTHGRTHHAAVLDAQGRLLGDREFPADRGGYRQLQGWFGRHGQVGVVGVEGTGSYGAGLTRVLMDQAWLWWRSTGLVWAPLGDPGVCESGDVGCVELLEFNRGAPAQGAMASLPVVEDLQVLKDGVG